MTPQGLNPADPARGPGPSRLLDPARLPGPVWVISPHPDDEALGCGALIAALRSQEREVWALLLSDGAASHPGSRAYPPARLARRRLAEWRAGLAGLGVPAGHTHALGLPDGALGSCDPQVVAERLRGAFQAAPPGTLVLPWQRDPHADHRAAWSLVMAARPAGVRVLGSAVWLGERGEPGDWPRADEARRWHFPVGEHAASKARAIAAHASQLGLIDDDPQGFTLAAPMVERATQGPEQFLELLTELPQGAQAPA